MFPDNYCGSVSYGIDGKGTCPIPNYTPILLMLFGAILMLCVLLLLRRLFPDIKKKILVDRQVKKTNEVNLIDWLMRFGMIGSLWLIIAVMSNDGSINFYLTLFIPSYMLFKMFMQLEYSFGDIND